MKSYFDLTELQLDALREISNIGSGNAATSLSMLLNRQINVSVPKVKYCTFRSGDRNDWGGRKRSSWWLFNS
jgi:chemotaxis protein CheC